MPCSTIESPPLTRREMLLRSANGFGALALAGLMTDRAYGLTPNATGIPHHLPKAKTVIFLYMDGGPAHMDTFDPKPQLTKDHGTPYKGQIAATQFNNIGTLLKSPWEFKRYGQCGAPVSDLLPYMAECVDDMTIVRSMTSNFSEHTNANYFVHTCFGQQGRPSAGSWITYGLGSECKDLPGFIVLNGGLIPPGGLDCFGSGFLPATYQASVIKAGASPVADLSPTEATPELQRGKLDLLTRLDKYAVGRIGKHDMLESAISNYELAFRMQAAVPGLLDFSTETEATRKLYGLDQPFKGTQTYGKLCLLARRLVEKGVRFIELTCPGVGHDRWDQHSNLKKGHEDNCRAVDQPIAALLKDLKARGLLNETLLIWGGEFGRTPMAQGSNGRDHNPFGFTMWMAGGGMKPGIIYGATDEYGYHAIENKVEMYDLHATVLHQLGIDHKKLTYRFGGRDMRLTDVHGEVVKEIIT